MTTRPRIASRIGLSFLAFLLVGQFSVWAWATGERAWREQLPASSFFNYETVAYVDTVGHELVMVSTSAWLDEIDSVAWVDVLRCESTDGTMGIFSTQSTTANNIGPRALSTSEWFYTQPFPDDGRPCEMHSTISIEERGVTKSISLATQPFTPGPSK